MCGTTNQLAGKESRTSFLLDGEDMILDGSITMLAAEDGVRIELRDNASSSLFAVVKLSPTQFCQAMSRLAHTPCEKMEVFDLEKLGKTLEYKPFEFEMPIVDFNTDRKKEADELVRKLCPKGWTPDLYFNSQSSFFRRDEKSFARTTIRRWVKKTK